MQHGFCIDNRNEPKWSVPLEAADNIGAGAVVYAAMFTPDQKLYGNCLNPWTRRDGQRSMLPKVQQFFEQERQLVLRGNSKDLWRVGNLDSRIRSIQLAYNWDQQFDYVNLVLAAVKNHRIDQKPVVVLLDPCNGIAVVRHHRPRVRHLRISPTAVAVIWNGLRAGDLLVVWQWPHPSRIPANDPVSLLSRAIHENGFPQPAAGVEVHGFGPFAMLMLKK